MNIKKIKVKPWLNKNKSGIIPHGRKIIIYTPESQDLSIVEIEKITEFFKTLRA